LSDQAVATFRTAMDNDFNSAEGLAAVFVFVGGVNAVLEAQPTISESDRTAAMDALRSMDEVLGLLEVARASRSVDDDLAGWVEQKIRDRSHARGSKDFAAADAIRDELAARSIVLEDGVGGTRWKVVN
jgi:cysteinyl-tRNA synthetase